MAVEDVERLRDGKGKKIEVRFADEAQAESFVEKYRADGKETVWRKGALVGLQVHGSMDAFLKAVSQYHVLDLQTQSQSLEELFLHFYGEGEK